MSLVTNCGLLQGGPVAAEFQHQGAVFVLQSTDMEAAKPVLARNGVELGPAVRLLEAYFSRPGIAERSVDQLMKEYGRIDVLGNNSGPEHIDKPLAEIEDAEWDGMFRLIVTELFYTTRAVLRRMIPRKRGKIVNIAAAGGINPYPGPTRPTARPGARSSLSPKRWDVRSPPSISK